jgi:pSer/pThr/pTyr-binding forkhead associated (FHA) protein
VGGATLVIHEGAGAGSQHPVEGELILGREQGTADLVIEDPGVSRRHARLFPENGALVVEDLGSSNGTYVNGERISGPVAVAPGDEVQLGDTVIGVGGGTAATALMPRGAPPTEAQPGPAPRRPAPHQPSPSGRPAPHRLAPPPHEPGNLPALAALFLGPLSILLLFLSAGGFFLALPCGIGAIVLGTIGIRNADRQRGHRTLARLGRFTGIVGTFLATLALIVFIVVAAALDTAESSVGGLIDRIRDEIDKVDIPELNTPDPNAPGVNTQEAPR